MGRLRGRPADALGDVLGAERLADSLRMFPDPAEMKKLKLKQTIACDSGVALLIYERAES